MISPWFNLCKDLRSGLAAIQESERRVQSHLPEKALGQLAFFIAALRLIKRREWVYAQMHICLA